MPKAPSDIVHEVLDAYFSSHVPARDGTDETAYEAFRLAGSIGCVCGLPRDLSTNTQRYLEGFGRQIQDRNRRS